MAKTIVFNITPKTWVKRNRDDRALFHTPEEKLSKYGRDRKRAIERYMDYKNELGGQARTKRFVLPESGCVIKFFIPIAKRVPKYKRREMHLRGHQQRPDLSNLLKAFEDSLLAEDKGIYEYSGMGKYWVDHTEGWIEVSILE